MFLLGLLSCSLALSDFLPSAFCPLPSPSLPLPPFHQTRFICAFLFAFGNAFVVARAYLLPATVVYTFAAPSLVEITTSSLRATINQALLSVTMFALGTDYEHTASRRCCCFTHTRCRNYHALSSSLFLSLSLSISLSLSLARAFFLFLSRKWWVDRARRQEGGKVCSCGIDRVTD